MTPAAAVKVRRALIAVTLVLAIVIGYVMVLAPLRNAAEVADTAYELTQSDALAARSACADSVSDRVSTVQVRLVQAQSAAGIAADPFQSSRTHAIRRREARVLWRSVVDTAARVDPINYALIRRQVPEDLRRMMPAAGGLDCKRAFPLPRAER